MAWINSYLEDFVKSTFPNRTTRASYEPYSRQRNRYIQLATSLADDMDIHYELYCDHVELHLEGKYKMSEYKDFCKALRLKTLRNPMIEWKKWQGVPNHSCALLKHTKDWSDVRDAFNLIIDIFDELIADCTKQHMEVRLKDASFKHRLEFHETTLAEEDVCLDICRLGTIFAQNIVIPDYQRNYCWGKKEVMSLWKTLNEMVTGKEYHLGIIILHKTAEGEYCVIDGQQRLVTLTLICKSLGYSGSLPLLSQTFHSKESKDQIGRNLYLINKLIKESKDSSLLNKIINNLRLSVLILREGKLELAYTFFSNVNSKGVLLSDLDLLKAHHLRFLENEEQTEWIVEKWNKTLLNDYVGLEETLSTHLLRLRAWLRHKQPNLGAMHPTFDEYSAAPEIGSIHRSYLQADPYSKISGGEYFFTFASRHLDEYKSFLETPEISSLLGILKGETHGRYSSVIVTLTFAYYLKFGKEFLAEAMFAIIGNISQHRYKKSAIKKEIERAAMTSDIVFMLLQAPSPSFFIAECLNSIQTHPLDLEDLSGIKLRYYSYLQDLYIQLESRFTVPSIIDTLSYEYNW